MKRKFTLVLMALLMTLFSVNANAQSSGTPIKGDVDGNGVVNAADVVAVVSIIMEQEGQSGGTKYYRYAGIAEPTAENIASIALGSSNEIPNWNTHILQFLNETESDQTAYIAIPADFNAKFTDSSGTYEMNLVEDGTFTYNGVTYEVKHKNSPVKAGKTQTFYVTTKTEKTTYYWYAGIEIPTAENIRNLAIGSSNEKPSWDKYELVYQNNTSEIVEDTYVAVPQEWNVRFSDSSGTFTMDLTDRGTFIYNGVVYQIWENSIRLKTGRTSRFYANTQSENE